MDLLLITDNLEFRDEGLYTSSLAQGLHETGHNVSVAAPPGPLVSDLEQSGVTVHLMPFLEEPRLEVFKVQTFCSMVSSERDWDAIHLHDLSISPLISRAAARMDVPYFLTLQEFEEGMEPDDLHREQLIGVIAPNEALREHGVNDLRIPKEKIEVIQPGVDSSRLRYIPVLQKGKQPIVALSTPLFRENKVDLFPKIARAITDMDHDVTFLVMGYGEMESSLRKKVEHLDLSDRVIFQSSKTIYYEILPEIDVLLSTHPRLELGILLLHAMGCGKPVISSGAGGAYHFIRDQETGFLVSLSGGEGEMVEKLDHLLKNPEIGRNIGKQAREHVVENFSLERMIQETTSHFTRFLEES